MNGRRNFLAFLGGASVTGIATTRASAITPTLILPPSFVPAPATAMPADIKRPLLAACDCQMAAVLKVERFTPDDVFRDWLESGLRVAQLYNGRPEAELDRLFASGITVAEVRGKWA